jgi:Immunoglobulin-like domain of bacterial spore germination/Sporulation and spore germination
MPRRLIWIGAAALLLAGCGSKTHQTSTVSTTPRELMSLTVFDVVDGQLHARSVRVPKTEAVAGAALEALGFDTSVTISGGTATVGLSSATPAQAAEIVYTLTQFPTIRRVDIDGRKGLVRNDVVSFAPPILIETPASGADVPSSITVNGTASVFEATLVVELRQDGKVVQHETVTASEGAPGRGAFSVALTAPKTGPATVAAFAPSAADGSPQHEQDVPVTVS